MTWPRSLFRADPQRHHAMSHRKASSTHLLGFLPQRITPVPTWGEKEEIALKPPSSGSFPAQ